jgi:glycosyltransferase involved in cell wall biosynthesis
MKIGILGTRGIPNAYGGFEQFAQHLAIGLKEKNHQVFVYNSSEHPYQKKLWNGVNILVCKDWEGRIGTAGQFLYDYNCLQDARRRNFDILLQLGYTSNSIWHRLWPKNSVNVVNMDGLEWKRTKYAKATRRFLRHAEKLAAKHADVLISDSIGIRDYILQQYKKNSHYIPYGAEVPHHIGPLNFPTWEIKPFQYYLVVARVEPENNIELIIQGFLQSKKTFPLLIIGNPTNKFGMQLKEKYQDAFIRFVGSMYDMERLNTLRFNALLYFHGHSVGGTNPSLLEAMACGCNIAAHDNIFNRAILEESAYYFTGAAEIASILDSPVDQQMINDRKRSNAERIRKYYDWDTVIEAYERVFESALYQRFN